MGQTVAPWNIRIVPVFNMSNKYKAQIIYQETWVLQFALPLLGSKCRKTNVFSLTRGRCILIM